MRISDRLAESLLERSGVFTKKQLTELHKQSLKAKKPLQDLIIENDLLSEAELTSLYANELQLPFVEVPAGRINHQVLTRLPEHVASRYKAIVFDIDDDNDGLLVAIEDPIDAQALNFLQKRLGDNLKLHITTASLMRTALEQYRANRSHSLLRVMAHQDGLDNSQTVNAALVAEGSAAAESLHYILEQALANGASDVHIEPRLDHLLIRYRIDGLLREGHKLPLASLGLLIGSVKTAGKLKLDEHHAPQYGQWNIAVGDQHYGIRATILPTVDGEKVVLHIVHESAQAPSLRVLGLWGSGLHDLQTAVTEPHGALFVAGPIGSGKAMTLFSLLSLLNSPSVSIATIEDPVQYRIAGANQVQVNPGAGVTLSSGLQAIVAQDPNIIMLSDLRDKESSRLVIQAAQSGHLVLSALHSTSAAAGVRRLLDMGNEPHMVASTLQAVVGQRLVRQLCPDCREEITPGAKTLKQIEKILHSEDFKFRQLHELEASALEVGIGVLNHGKTAASSQKLSSSARGIARLWEAHDGGCVRCNNTGYHGRVGIFEVLTPSATVEKAILGVGSVQAIHQAALKSGMLSLRLDGLVKALRGQTTVAEVLRVST